MAGGVGPAAVLLPWLSADALVSVPFQGSS